MNVQDKMYCKEVIECEKVDYENRIREEMITYRDRYQDTGDEDRLVHANKEIKRLDEKFEIVEQ